MRFLENQRPHAGLLIVAQSLGNDDTAGIARALVVYSQSHEGSATSYAIDYLSAARSG